MSQLLTYCYKFWHIMPKFDSLPVKNRDGGIIAPTTIFRHYTQYYLSIQRSNRQSYSLSTKKMTIYLLI
jgi:hypothetical protein